MLSLSISVVLFNNDSTMIDKLVENVEQAVEGYIETTLFFINNSPDNLRLKKHLEKYQDSKWIHVVTATQNKGFGAGNNLVLSKIKSTYHLVMNPDITIDSTIQLKKMIDFMDAHEEYGLLAPLIKFPNGEVQHLLKRKSSVWDMAIRFVKLPGTRKRKQWFVSLPEGYSYVHKAENVPGSFLLFRTSVFQSINGFDERYFLYMEDCDITMKVNQVSSTVFFPDAFVYHEWQRENKKTIRGVIRMIVSMFVYFNKWGWKLR